MRQLSSLKKHLSVACIGALGLAAARSPLAAVPSRDLAFVLARTPDPVNGGKLYETCAACHGARGEGVSDGSVPAIAGQSFSVVAKQLVDFRIGVRSDPRMGHFSDTTHLSYSQEVADVASYISHLPPRVSTVATSDVHITRGAALYERRCERCHGAMGEGNEAGFAPPLAGQHAAYLARQLTEESATARPGMNTAHRRAIDGLSPADVAAIALSLSSFLPSGETE